LRDERIAAYLAEGLTPAQRAAFEHDIANDPEGLAELVAQQCVDAGLRALLDSETQRVESAIMATVRGSSEEAAVENVLSDTVRAAQPRQKTSRGVFDWLNAVRWR